MPFTGRYEGRPGTQRGTSCHDGAQISHGLMTAENGFFGAARQDNPATPDLA
jgi:hypothetical protein